MDGDLNSSPREAELRAELARSRQAEQRAQRRFRSAFGHQFQFMAILSPSGEVLDFNAQLSPGAGVPREQIIGRLFWDTLWWDGQPALRAAWPLRLQQAAASDQAIVSEDSFTSFDGQPRWAAAAIHAVRDDDGGLDCFIVQASDITERKQAERLRSELEAQLREAQKMDAIGSLAGGIAHDFNNILGAILGNVALARDLMGEGHAAQQPLEQISLAGRRARSLVQQILAFSRRQPQALQVQPLQPVVEETLAMLRTTLPAGVHIHTRLANAALWVRCDATQMQQVLLNLGTNAWQALAGRGGRVEVGLEPTAAGGVHLWVSDNGTGMDAATRERIFEPFFTTKAKTQGTGLGLAVVRGIVVEHGGTITVDSVPGQGSVFHVHLPGAALDAEGTHTAATDTATRAPVLSGQGRHVLYLDDDDVMVPVARRLLQRAGYRVSSFAEPEAALAAVRAAPATFDIVVTDYNMPGRDGLDVAREVASLAPGLPLIISSGYIPESLRRDAAAQGVHHLLNKENTLEDLCRLVGEVLEGAAGRRGADGAEGRETPSR